MTHKANGERTVLVTGATGHQGGAAARHLLASGFRVRALTRHPEKPTAQALARQGAEIARGDLDDLASVERALKGAYGVFSVQSVTEAGVEGEVRQGTRLADAARSAGVRHFVYTSVGSAHRNTGIPHFESKWRIEEHIRAIGLPDSVLRPVFFMENWGSMMRDAILNGRLAQPLDPETPLQQVAVDDIGAFAALAFARPEAWLGRAVDLAGDELTMQEVAAAFSRILGRPVSYAQVPWEALRQAMGDEFTVMYRWFQDVGYAADIEALRREYPALTSFEQYLRRSDWK